MTTETDGPNPGEEMADLAGLQWTAAHTQTVLGSSADESATRRPAGTILGVASRNHNGRVWYPVMQFHRHEREVRVIPAIERFLMILRDHDPWTILVHLRMPAEQLDGLSPVAFVNGGGDPDVLARYAEIMHAELTQP